MMAMGLEMGAEKAQSQESTACSGGTGQSWNPFGGQKPGQLNAPQHNSGLRFPTKSSCAMLDSWLTSHPTRWLPRFRCAVVSRKICQPRRNTLSRSAVGKKQPFHRTAFWLPIVPRACISRRFLLVASQPGQLRSSPLIHPGQRLEWGVEFPPFSSSLRYRLPEWPRVSSKLISFLRTSTYIKMCSEGTVQGILSTFAVWYANYKRARNPDKSIRKPWKRQTK